MVVLLVVTEVRRWLCLCLRVVDASSGGQSTVAALDNGCSCDIVVSHYITSDTPLNNGDDGSYRGIEGGVLVFSMIMM